jgi:hypothetical protein
MVGEMNAIRQIAVINEFKERWVKERWVPAEKPAAVEKQREVKETRIQEKRAPVEKPDVTERQKGFK